MKKMFTLFTAVCASLASMATDYNGKLMVLINGNAAPSQEAGITVNKQDNGKYTLELKNFMLGAGADAMAVGNITLTDTEGTDNANGTVNLKTTQTITITNGDLPGVPMWLGPMLGEIPVSLDAELDAEKTLAATIDIPFATMNMQIKVLFDSRAFHIGNSDFENFHTANLYQPLDDGSDWNYEAGPAATSDEPDYWHSFMSASGIKGYIYLAGYTPHTFVKDVVRPGSAGTKSVLLTSADMGFFGVANGTITTGRINTGSYSAADLSNHSWSAIDSVGTDDKGDPFYSLMAGQPDSLTLWVKFKQLTPQAEFPYATVKAVITDGKYYQDPEDKEYDNIIAKATNNTIESKNFEWQKITVPFVYTDNDKEGKVIHVTISTNAEPGKGSTDSLFVDDLSLIYNCKLNGLKVKGQDIDLSNATFNPETNSTVIMVNGFTGKDIIAEDIEATANGKGAKVISSVGYTDTDTHISLSVVSNDLRSFNTYNVVLPGTVTGIECIDSPEAANTVKAVYNMKGQKVGTMKSGEVYVTKYANGKTVKSIKK
ncbi:MAG: PCMD domain-containing protein [Prevotella sp.]|nr:PCMD domain-containing protein [Prevotella sp.]